MISRILGARIAVRRKAQKLTQAQLAERLGLTVEAFSRIERGAAVPALPRIEAIAKALGCEVSDLLRTRERSDRRDRAIERVIALLRSRPIDEVELVGNVLEVVFRRR